MSKTADVTHGIDLVYSSEIMGAVVKALDLDQGFLKGKTARRFFDGKPVSENSRGKIFHALSEAFVKLGVVPAPAFLEKYGTPMPVIVGETLDVTCKRWDALLALMQSRSAPVQDREIAINGFLRLVIVDLALRIFAFARLADLDPTASETPIWAEDNSRRKLLRGLVKNAGMTREELADRMQKSDTSVDNWLDGKIRPTRKNVTALAEALTRDKPNPDTRRIEHAIQLQFTFAHLADLLVPVIGRKQVIELSTALYRFVRLITENVEGMQRPPIEENPTAEIVALVYGTAHPSTFPLLEDLASTEMDRVWKNYIMASAGSWEVAFQRIAIEAGLPRTAAGLAQDISELSPHESNYRGNLKDAETSSLTREIRERMMQESSIDNTSGVVQGDIDALTRTLESVVALRRDLVRDFPTDPEAHFNLGSFLGMLGKWTRRRDLIDEGINECKIASLLLPGWDAPAVETGIILANFGAYEEALQEPYWAKSILPEETPHLQYSFGYTLMMLERYEDALVHLEEVIKARPDYALALRDAARCSFTLGDHKNGACYAKKARQFGDPVEYDLWRSGEYSSRKTR